MKNTEAFIRKHGLEELERKFGIVVTRYDDRIVLNYNQIDSPKFHHICDECRGLILSWPGLNPICRPFDRFYNYGEGGEFSEKDFNPNRMISFAKIDGSLINIYHDGEDWRCATRKRAFAEGETTKGNTFKDVVDRAFPNWKDKMNAFSTNLTYIFEVVSPETRIVVPYSDYGIYLLAVRDNNYGDYIKPDAVEDIAKLLEVDVPKRYKFKNLDNVLKSAKELEPMDECGEGFVCFDPKTNNRVKIKNPAYLSIAHLRQNGAISNKRIATLVFQQDHEEYLQYFEEDREYFEPYIDAYNKMMKDINDYYELYNDIDKQKDFAMIVKDLKIAPILFSLRKGEKLNDIFDKLNDKKKFELLEYYKPKK